MKKLTIVITDSGDGSNGLSFIDGELADEQIDAIEAADKYGTFASGDGFQEKVLTFPDDFDLKSIGGIYELQTAAEFVTEHTQKN
jgi:hypothetical protein